MNYNCNADFDSKMKDFDFCKFKKSIYIPNTTFCMFAKFKKTTCFISSYNFAKKNLNLILK